MSRCPVLRSPALLILLAALLTGACVYRVDVQQGNLLDEASIDAVQVGMTRSQVRFLLGTPVVSDSFHPDRWDYMFSFREGRSRVPEQRWIIVFFEGDRVSEIRRDVPVTRPM
ncbi:MAG: outer membrane protein assembly factor BamE [Chromatiales bacterium]|nr:outer membrane protein assembly factor BamE [Chromatiales bacterium]